MNDPQPYGAAHAKHHERPPAWTRRRSVRIGAGVLIAALVAIAWLATRPPSGRACRRMAAGAQGCEGRSGRHPAGRRMSARLVADKLTRTLPPPDNFTLVRDASFALNAGEFVAILGPSGCGKSSLLYLLGLLDRPTEGVLSIEGVDTSALNDAMRTRTRLEQIGFVFQFHFLLPELTARQNIELPMRRLARLSKAGIADRAAVLLDKLGLTPQADRRPDRMSGGQRQRVAVARALANDPPIILGDEPTGNLDSGNTTVLIDEFRRLAHEDGRTVVCVTHDLDVAAAADRRIRMLDGRVVADER
jgi:lipoprotein-releasing system ATP-binding protein